MYQKEYRQMNEKILPREGLSDSVRERMGCGRKTSFRSVAAVAAVLALILAATPVMAENLPWILERIAPELTETLEPVGRSDTYNGITMEVVAASVKGSRAELVVKLQGESLKEPAGVMPYLHAHSELAKSASICSLHQYEGAEADRAAGIYYYRMETNYRKGLSLAEILEGEMTVYVNNVLINTLVGEEMELPLVLADQGEIRMTGLDDLRRRGYESFGWSDSEDYPHGCALGSSVMEPPTIMAYDVTEHLSLAAAMYIDGKLHIQMRTRNELDGHIDPGWSFQGPWLTDAKGNRAECIYRNMFAANVENIRLEYMEYVYDIPEDELEGYTLSIRQEYYETIPAGCKVTFRFMEDEVSAE